jgi:YhhN-like protein.
MTILIVFGALSVISAVLSGFFNFKGRTAPRLIAKLAASILFCIVGLRAAMIGSGPRDYASFVLAALIFGLLGDIFLCMDDLATDRGEIFFDGLGVLMFFIGHLFFVGIFLSATSFNYYLIPLIFLLPVLLALLINFKVIVAKKIWAGLVVYSAVLGLTLVSSINLYINERDLKSLLVMIAGILFAASDITLLFRNYSAFGKDKVRYLIYIVLVTYYIAQNIFAITIMM